MDLDLTHKAYSQRSSVHLAPPERPACLNEHNPSPQPPCFRHVLVIIKHNNGFYKSLLASLVTWIIQPKRERWGREREHHSSQVGPRTWRWQTTDEAFWSQLFIWFSATFSFFYNCHSVFFFLHTPLPLLLFPPFTLPPPHTHTHTH